jgi:hypothetical protein
MAAVQLHLLYSPAIVFLGVLLRLCTCTEGSIARAQRAAFARQCRRAFCYSEKLHRPGGETGQPSGGGVGGVLRGAPWASSLGAKVCLRLIGDWTMCFRWVRGVASRPSTYICSSEHLHSRSMSHLLSSVDPVLYCDINGLTHAPTVLSLAPSTGSVSASSLGSLGMVRFLVVLHRVVHSLSALQLAAFCSLHSFRFTPWFASSVLCSQ